MVKLLLAVLLCVACSCFAQKQNTTPVPILKQINRHNEDGSYSYGYEAADGSYKIETKAANGEVKGKYGYVDADGNLREISYGADKNGFSPEGTDINVPPPTIHNDRDSLYPKLSDGEIDDGQYREDPAIYSDPKYNSRPSSKAAAQFSRFNQSPAPKPFVPAQNYNYQPTPAPQTYVEPQTQTQRPFYQSRFQAPPAQNNYYQPQPQPQPQPQNYYQPQPQNYYRPSYNNNNNNNYYQPAPQTPHDIFQGHPATNFDIQTGSYSVNYVGR